MVKVNIFESECQRLCLMHMNLLELLGSNIISLDDYNKYKSVILSRFKDIVCEN